MTTLLAIWGLSAIIIAICLLTAPTGEQIEGVGFVRGE